MIYIKLICAFFIAFAFNFLLMPLITKLMKRLKAGQSILRYVDNHESKEGTPTMGGIGFILSASLITFLFCYFDLQSAKLGQICVAVTLSFGLLGFLDDFIKIKFKRNEGLKAYQKVIGQLGIAIIITIFAYNNPFVGSEIYIPFTSIQVNMSWWFIPFCIIVYIAVTNAVNLTDGLDGLVAKTSTVCFTAFFVITMIMMTRASDLGQTVYAQELNSIGYYLATMIGAILAFVWSNANPASIFMGDTGSLAIGAGIASAGIFLQNPLILLILGIMYILSCISVIIQVISFKLFKKRVFLMSPYHHHLQYKGIKESKIVSYYTIITILAAVVTVISYLV